jgi:predicted nucleotidyltransferase
MAKKRNSKIKNKKIPKELPKLVDKNQEKKEAVEFDRKKYPTLQLKTEHDIAMDFAVKVYKKFDKVIKSIVLFGSVAKEDSVAGSDIDIIIILDDASVNWDQELIAWYREELDKLLRKNPYEQNLHINTIKLSSWWEDLMRGDPVVINILRYGEVMIDYGGFFEPLKRLLLLGKIRPSPESIYISLQRAPMHLARSKQAELNSIEGLYWAMVDSSHAALIAINVLPPSPEHLAVDLRENFVVAGKLNMKYVQWYKEVLMLHKKIAHGQIKDLKASDIDLWQERTKEFIDVMAQLVNSIIS